MKYILLLALLFTACGDIDGSIYGSHVDSDMSKQNAKSLSKLTDNGEVLKFALISDSHNNHTDLESVIDDINRQDFDFAIHLGDVTNIALGMEFDLFADIIDNFRIPYFVAMGNHDAISSGERIYRKLFGEANFSFTFKGYKFIIINNNAKESNGMPDYDWIFAEILSTDLPVMIFQHIPPFDKHAFDSEQLQLNRDIIGMPQVRAVFYGHIHNFETDYVDGKLMQMIKRTEGENYATVRVVNDTITVECTGGKCHEGEDDHRSTPTY